MNKFNFSKFAKDVRMKISEHAPEILTGIGIAGMITTTVLAVKATPKALELINEKKQEENVDELKAIDVVKATWKCYVPATVTCSLSVACLVGASAVNFRRNAALAAAYRLSETALDEYRRKVIDTIGEKKERSIREEIDKDHLEQNPVSKNEVIVTSKGDTLCYDYQSGRYFYSDIEHIRKVVNTINMRLLREDYIPLNDFYEEIGLEHSKLGNELGWRVDKGLIDVQFGAQLADDGRPCIVVNFNIVPERDYWRFA